MQATENDVFQATPIQIKALVKACGWTQYEMGRFLGVSVQVCADSKGYKIHTSRTVQRWIAGVHRPGVQSRRQMLTLVDAFRHEYLMALRELTQ